MVEGLVLLVIVATIAYGIVDAIKALFRKDFWWPSLALAVSVYLAVVTRTDVLGVLGLRVLVNPIHSYVVTGILASLGAKGLHERFGDLVAKIKE